MLVLRSLLIGLFLATGAGAQTIRVGAAISLKQAIVEIGKAYEARDGEHVEFTFGSSGQVQAQIASGADIDVFISAANKQVDELIERGLALPTSRRVVAGNQVVLVVPADSKDAPSSFESLGGNGVKRVAIGEPGTVPAGAYAMQVLHSLNLADKLRDRIVYGANVRQVLSYVERGEVSVGIVYRTDAKESADKVKVVAVAGPKTHSPVVYPAVIIRAGAKRDAAERFLAFLGTDSAKAILVDKGFSVGVAEPSTQPAE